LIKLLKTKGKLQSAQQLLQNIIHLDHYTHRNLRGFSNLNRTKQALKRFYDLDLIELLLEFNGILPESGNKNHIFIPCRENLDYILVRLQGASKLIAHIIKCSKLAATFFLQFLAIGHFVEKNLFYIAMLSDIWFQCRDITLAIVTAYNKLHMLRMGFQEGAEWLPVGYKFPKDLAIFIEDVWRSDINIELNKSIATTMKSAVFDSFIENDGKNTADETNKTVSRKSDNTFSSKVTTLLKHSSTHKTKLAELSIEDIFKTVLDKNEFEQDMESDDNAASHQSNVEKMSVDMDSEDEGESIKRNDYSIEKYSTVHSNKRKKN
jgi:hypothetical protein